MHQRSLQLTKRQSPFQHLYATLALVFAVGHMSKAAQRAGCEGASPVGWLAWIPLQPPHPAGEHPPSATSRDLLASVTMGQYVHAYLWCRTVRKDHTARPITSAYPRGWWCDASYRPVAKCKKGVWPNEAAVPSSSLSEQGREHENSLTRTQCRWHPARLARTGSLR